MTILVTGGAGYIGSHTVVELLDSKYEVVIIDDFSNSSPEVLKRIEKITGKKPKLYKGDVGDKTLLKTIFAENDIEAVMHFAGFKAVGVSMEQPLDYYRNNLGSTLALSEALQANGVRKLIFSSSATVYGEPRELPIKETTQAGVGLANPYGRTKYMIEQILNDLAASDPHWQITALRYFNSVGAHASGLIGENPDGLPNNLMPYVSKVAVGELDKVRVFGDDYNTPDGTGIRDYVHVVDVAKGHVAALKHLKPNNKIEVFNLGVGKGASVLEVIKAYEKAANKNISYVINKRRAGDIAVCYADVSKAKKDLQWQAKNSLKNACEDSWRWQLQNPAGL